MFFFYFVVNSGNIDSVFLFCIDLSALVIFALQSNLHDSTGFQYYTCYFMPFHFLCDQLNFCYQKYDTQLNPDVIKVSMHLS